MLIQLRKPRIKRFFNRIIPFPNLISRVVPFFLVGIIALLVFFAPDIAPKTYSDLATYFETERVRQSIRGYTVAAVENGAVIYNDGFGKDSQGFALTADTLLRNNAMDEPLAALVAFSLFSKEELSNANFNQNSVGQTEFKSYSTNFIFAKRSPDDYIKDAKKVILLPLQLKETKLISLSSTLTKSESGFVSFYFIPLIRSESTESGKIGVFSTAKDTGKFLTYLFSTGKKGKPTLSLEQYKMLFSPPARNTYGWTLVQQDKDILTFSSSSSTVGFSSYLRVWPNSNRAIAIMCNQSSYLLSNFILPRLAEGAGTIMSRGSTMLPFSWGRLYILLTFAMFIQLFLLSRQVMRAKTWALHIRGIAEAEGSRSRIILATIRCWIGILARLLCIIFVPLLISFSSEQGINWLYVVYSAPDFSIWLFSVIFFYILRNISRLVWLGNLASGLWKWNFAPQKMYIQEKK